MIFLMEKEKAWIPRLQPSLSGSQSGLYFEMFLRSSGPINVQCKDVKRYVSVNQMRLKYLSANVYIKLVVCYSIVGHQVIL